MKFQKSHAKSLCVESFQFAANFRRDDLDFGASSQSCRSNIRRHYYLQSDKYENAQGIYLGLIELLYFQIVL